MENTIIEKLNYDKLGNLQGQFTSIISQISEFGTIILNVKPNINIPIEVYPYSKDGYSNSNISQYNQTETIPLSNEFKYDSDNNVLVFNSSQAGMYVLINLDAIGRTYMSSKNVATRYDGNGGLIESLDDALNVLMRESFRIESIPVNSNMFKINNEGLYECVINHTIGKDIVRVEGLLNGVVGYLHFENLGIDSVKIINNCAESIIVRLYY